LIHDRVLPLAYIAGPIIAGDLRLLMMTMPV